MVDVPRPEHRCPTHVTMPLSDAVALGRVAEMWANLTPEVRAAEFQTRHGTVSINVTTGRITYDPRPEIMPF